MENIKNNNNNNTSNENMEIENVVNPNVPEKNNAADCKRNDHVMEEKSIGELKDKIGNNDVSVSTPTSSERINEPKISIDGSKRDTNNEIILPAKKSDTECKEDSRQNDKNKSTENEDNLEKDNDSRNSGDTKSHDGENYKLDSNGFLKRPINILDLNLGPPKKKKIVSDINNGWVSLKKSQSSEEINDDSTTSDPDIELEPESQVVGEILLNSSPCSSRLAFLHFFLFTFSNFSRLASSR